MNEQTLTEVIKLKLRIMETIVNDLPDDLRTPLQHAKRTFLKALHDATGAYLAEDHEKKAGPDVKPIPID